MTVEQAAPPRLLTYVPAQRNPEGPHGFPATRPAVVWHRARRRLVVWLVEVAVVVTLVAVLVGDVR